MIDPKLNSQLADTFFSSPALVKAFMLKEIATTQKMLNHRLEELFTDVALKKYPEMKKTVEDITDPLKTHVFDLMEKDLKTNDSLQVTTVYRDRYDVNVLQGKAKPKADRIGSEGGDTTFTVKRHEQGGLLFEIDALPKKEFVRITKDGTGQLKFEDLPVEKPTLPKESGEFMTIGTEAERMEESFGRLVNVFTVEQLKTHGKTAIEEGKRIVNKLLQTTSLVEYFNGLRQTTIYPHTEYLVSTDKLKHVVGLFTPPESVNPTFN